jgi:hypothetical protein
LFDCRGPYFENLGYFCYGQSFHTPIFGKF